MIRVRERREESEREKDSERGKERESEKAIETATERQRDRGTERETERERQKERERESEKDRGRQGVIRWRVRERQREKIWKHIPRFAIGTIAPLLLVSLTQLRKDPQIPVHSACYRNCTVDSEVQQHFCGGYQIAPTPRIPMGQN